MKCESMNNEIENCSIRRVWIAFLAHHDPPARKVAFVSLARLAQTACTKKCIRTRLATTNEPNLLASVSFIHRNFSGTGVSVDTMTVSAKSMDFYQKMIEDDTDDSDDDILNQSVFSASSSTKKLKKKEESKELSQPSISSLTQESIEKASPPPKPAMTSEQVEATGKLIMLVSCGVVYSFLSLPCCFLLLRPQLKHR